MCDRWVTTVDWNVFQFSNTGLLSVTFLCLAWSVIKYLIETRIFCSMALLEHNGIAIDTRRLAELSANLQSRKMKLQDEAWRIVGRKFNLNSIPELRKVNHFSLFFNYFRLSCCRLSFYDMFVILSRVLKLNNRKRMRSCNMFSALKACYLMYLCSFIVFITMVC